jgi:hypothetical protein
MNAVLQHIFRLKRDYARLPFFDFLRDETRPPRERLAFFPCMASFIMAFGDLNRLVLREEPTDDPYQRMINAHTYEDDHHWPWYLEDFSKLGHDRVPVAPGATIRLLYSDATIQNRLLSLRLASLIWNAEPVVRLAIIEAIEEAGNVLFALTSSIATRFRNETGVELRYCGEFHFQRESGHAMNNDHAELAGLELTEAQRRDALERVDKVFAWFCAWTQELLAYACAVPPLEPPAAHATASAAAPAQAASA